MPGDPNWGRKPDEPLHVDVAWRVVNFLQALWLASFTVFCFFCVTLFLIVTFSRRLPLYWARKVWGPINIKAAFARFEVEGREHVGAGPCVVMMNHQSLLDIAVAFAACPGPIRFIAKRETIFIPFVGWYMWAMGMVFVDRRNLPRAIAALRKGAQALKGGGVLFAYPEGTRTKDGTIGPFKKGLFMLAIEAGVPIVPCACEGAGRVLPVQGWHPRPGTIRVKFGAPIPTQGYDASTRDVLIAKVRDAMIDLHEEIGGLGGDRDRATTGRGVDHRRAERRIAAG